MAVQTLSFKTFISLFQRYIFCLTLFLLTNFIKGIFFKSLIILINSWVGIIVIMIVAKLNSFTKLTVTTKKATIKINIIKDILLMAINFLTLESLIFSFPENEILPANLKLRLLDIFCGEFLFLRGFYFKINELISITIFSVSLIIKFDIYDYNIVFTLSSLILIMIATKFEGLKSKTCEHFHLSSSDLGFEVDKELNILSINYNFMKYLKVNHLNEKEFFKSLIKNRIYQKKEYISKPEIKNIISDVINSKNDEEDKEETLESYLKSLHSRNEQKIFCLGRIQILQKKEVIYIWKKTKGIFIKIKQDQLFNEALNLKSLVQNYSKTIYYIAHELRNPLNCVLNLELIDSFEKNSFDILNTEYIHPAIISSKLMLNLVNGLLDIAQIEADTFKLVIVEFNLNTLLEEIIEVMRFQAKIRGIELNLYLDPQIKKIKSDPNRISQIVINLLSNFYN